MQSADIDMSIKAILRQRIDPFKHLSHYGFGCLRHKRITYADTIKVAKLSTRLLRQFLNLSELSRI